MQDHEATTSSADAKLARQARSWRRADKFAIAEKTDAAKRAEYHERQKLRQVVDLNPPDGADSSPSD